jgi:hypothetical protein
MNAQRAYKDRPQVVLVVRTASLIAAHEERVRLSRINSGATMPFAWGTLNRDVSDARGIRLVAGKTSGRGDYH